MFFLLLVAFLSMMVKTPTQSGSAGYTFEHFKGISSDAMAMVLQLPAPAWVPGIPSVEMKGTLLAIVVIICYSNRYKSGWWFLTILKDYPIYYGK